MIDQGPGAGMTSQGRDKAVERVGKALADHRAETGYEFREFLDFPAGGNQSGVQDRCARYRHLWTGGLMVTGPARWRGKRMSEAWVISAFVIAGGALCVFLSVAAGRVPRGAVRELRGARGDRGEASREQEERRW